MDLSTVHHGVHKLRRKKRKQLPAVTLCQSGWAAKSDSGLLS